MDTHRRESLTRKHLAERRRRAKINYYLDEIEALISPPATKGTPVKMEKAELLEKTVAYLKALRSSGVDFRHFRHQQLPRLQAPRVGVYSPYNLPPITDRTSRQDDAITDEFQPLNLKTQSDDDAKEQNSTSGPEGLNPGTPKAKDISDISSAGVTLFPAASVECGSDPRTCDTSVGGYLPPELVVKQESDTDLSLYTLDPTRSGNLVWRPWKKLV
ncbi:uncharacterized protein LOC124118027 [Haliotis rufescens]|uniref:uncharacterized protein LOC124118027 n=1 Tax=Haliotis rufescens TaxID=6454 RepID=UPI00201EC38F|nr:uncharacterized protein LOC124118027 [Haliotis rufescens]